MEWKQEANSLLSHNKIIFYVLAAFLAACYATVRFSFLGQYPPATLALLTAGEAATPFQYRDLIPSMVDLLTTAVGSVGLQLSHDYFYVVTEVVAAFLIILSLQYYLFLLLAQKDSSYRFSLVLFPLLAINYVLPRNYPYFYPSDTPAVLFMLLGLILLYRRKWGLYYLVFALGAWNRETICFLTFAYLFTAVGRENTRIILIHVVMQFLIWLTIKAGLYWLYANNAGAGLFERYHSGSSLSHFSSNVQLLTTPSVLLAMLSSFGFIWLFVVLRYSTIGDSFVRNALKVFWPYFIGMFLVANIDEIRVWGELFPYVVPAFALVWTSGGLKRT